MFSLPALLFALFLLLFFILLPSPFFVTLFHLLILLLRCCHSLANTQYHSSEVIRSDCVRSICSQVDNLHICICIFHAHIVNNTEYGCLRCPTFCALFCLSFGSWSLFLTRWVGALRNIYTETDRVLVNFPTILLCSMHSKRQTPYYFMLPIRK